MTFAARAAKPETDAGALALERLKEREDVLEICYWYQGEGLGDVFTPRSVMPFLTGDAEVIADTFERLVAEGAFERRESGYVFTADGKRRSARLFVETFTDFQQGGHGECRAGCCDGDEPCQLDASGVCNHPHHRLRYVEPEQRR